MKDVKNATQIPKLNIFRICFLCDSFWEPKDSYLFQIELQNLLPIYLTN